MATNAPTFSVRTINRPKDEKQIVQSIRKATSPDETAPKQKHVRAITVYTHDYQSSTSFWNGLKSIGLSNDGVQAFKGLITIHKVLREGHAVVLQEGLYEIRFVEALSHSADGSNSKGYGPLIKGYAHFLQAKLKFHRTHPSFTADFKYEDYLSLKETTEPNEGFQTISHLLDLQDEVEAFRKVVFHSFRPATDNECRISALVPLVEESYGLYRFITHMLIAMHQTFDDSVDAFELLRTRYYKQYQNLRTFYDDCNKLRYLTSLIKLPELPINPPDLFGKNKQKADLGSAVVKREPAQLKVAKSTSDDSAQDETQRQLYLIQQQRIEVTRRRVELQQQQVEQERMRQEQLLEQQRVRQQQELQEQQRLQAEALRLQQQKELEEQQRIQVQMLQMQRQRELEEQQRRQAEMLRLQQERELEEQRRLQEAMVLQRQHEYEQQQRIQQERERQAQEQMMRQLQMQREFEEQQRQQAERERLAREQFEREQRQRQVDARIKEQEQRLFEMNSLHERNQIVMSQYERKIKALEDEAQQSQFHAREQEKAHADLVQALQNEIAALKAKYETLAKLYAQLRQEHLDLATKYKEASQKAAAAAELQAQKEYLQKELQSKTQELADWQSKHQGLKSRLEGLQQTHQEETRLLKQELSALQQRMDDMVRLSEEEIAIMQAGMDQSLLNLAEATREKEHLQQLLANQQAEHQLSQRAYMQRIMDSIFQSCVDKIEEGVYEFDSLVHGGNVVASPEHVLSMTENSNQAALEFTMELAKYLDPEVEDVDHTLVIGQATSFAQSLVQLLHNVKGIYRLTDDVMIDKLNDATHEAATAVQTFFSFLISSRLEHISLEERPQMVLDCQRDVQETLMMVTTLVEEIKKGTQDSDTALALNTKELGDLVEQEMNNAALVITAALERLASLQAVSNPMLTNTELQVHKVILEASTALMHAIAYLIQCATNSQKEIVAQNRGSGTQAEFYKKHNRWTEGLISAAKAVAVATHTLVESADGVIQGTHNLEQLIVASNEVSSSTIQLVAAARVKALPYSKTQDNLELAAKAVTDASKALVKVVKEITSRQLEHQASKVDFASLTPHDFKVQEMQQQVEILQLENNLTMARRRLADMRRAGYHTEDTA